MPFSDLWLAHANEGEDLQPQDTGNSETEVAKELKRSRQTSKARHAALKAGWERSSAVANPRTKETWGSILQGKYFTKRLFNLGSEENDYQKMASERARCVFSLVTLAPEWTTDF